VGTSVSQAASQFAQAVKHVCRSRSPKMAKQLNKKEFGDVNKA
jgi:hypothetical protein